MFFADLSQECQVDSGFYVRAIGWLSVEQPIVVGIVQPEFVSALKKQTESPWQPVVAAGIHACEFCNKAASGSNIWIPSKEVVYVTPALISHYIESHDYKPPDEFIEAVLLCPPQGSDEYFSLMRRFPAWWVEFLEA